MVSSALLGPLSEQNTSEVVSGLTFPALLSNSAETQYYISEKLPWVHLGDLEKLGAAQTCLFPCSVIPGPRVLLVPRSGG